VSNSEIIEKLDYKEMGKRIRTRRRELNITQEQVAERAGISTSFIGHIERGEKVASVETLATLSEVLDMDLNYMILGVNRDDGCERMKKEISAVMEKYK